MPRAAQRGGDRCVCNNLSPMQIGIDSFVSTVTDPGTGAVISPVERVHHLLEEVERADQVGLDTYGIGEHHRREFMDSAPAVLLAAAAARTSTIRLNSAVTVLSAADPVRVFQEFATVDLISGGRVELVVGRGSFTEAFPLFGLDLADYDELFDEKLDLLLRLNRDEQVTWQGKHRPGLVDTGVYPRPIQAELPIWIAVGGTPASVVRAGRNGLPLYLAILGQPERFAPLADLYRQHGTDAGHDLEELRIGVTSHVHVDTTSQRARDTFYPYYSRYIGNNMPGARGQLLPRDAFDSWAGPRGALFAGSPLEIIDKIMWEHELLGHDRFLAQIGLGGLPFADTARSIELLATEVLPVVRRELRSEPTRMAPATSATTTLEGVA
jgi:probable LLM family oxidoreductase